MTEIQLGTRARRTADGIAGWLFLLEANRPPTHMLSTFICTCTRLRLPACTPHPHIRLRTCWLRSRMLCSWARRSESFRSKLACAVDSEACSRRSLSSRVATVA
jgi:hypothetical protein